MHYSDLPVNILNSLRKGVVIPALPLALDRNRKPDTRSQQALLRYYLDAGAGGIAVAVHTTQFAIRKPEINLFKPVLEIAAAEFDRYSFQNKRPVIRVAGVIGKTPQALKEAQLALDMGYHAILLGLAAFSGASNEEILSHCRTLAGVMPVIGFYLQPAVGGRVLDEAFWKEFASIDNVIAIKIAPFNRYHTLDVVRGVVASGRADEIALYTGNDDNIVIDLLTDYQIKLGDQIVSKRIVGGLLGHWAVWTHAAVNLLHKIQLTGYRGDLSVWLTLAAKITDSNAAFFDAAHGFAGCIAGLHEVLRRQGLMESILTLDEHEGLSPGQKEEIDRVYDAYPELNDDAFVAANLHKWLHD